MQKSWGWKAGVGWTILSVLDWWLLAAGGWLTWRSLLLKWTPIGVGLATFIHWHLHNQKCDRLGQPRTASKIMVGFAHTFLRFAIYNLFIRREDANRI